MNLPPSLATTLQDQYQTFLQRDRGLSRDLLFQLKEHLNSPQILIITGLRRVGKSTLLAQLAHHYFNQNFYFVNFEDERLLDFRAQDFDRLHQTLISLFGDHRTFFLDEIQNVPQWEHFVRRLHDQGYKLILTGSNASLLSRELSTKLTGRHLTLDLFPFSFSEFLRFHYLPTSFPKTLTSKDHGRWLKLTSDYLNQGGLPDFLKYAQPDFHKTLYRDILYRDIVARYQLTNIKALQELAFYLLSNVANLISFNKLKNLLKLGSVNTVKNYINYLENSWLFFSINKYAYSVKEQQIAAKKIYTIDTGLAKSVGFSFSPNSGRLIENLVFLHLRRYFSQIFYYKTNTNREIDFYLPQANLFIQVAQDLSTPATQTREIEVLIEASHEQRSRRPRLILITHQPTDSPLSVEHSSIEIWPLYRWLLSDPSTLKIRP